MKLTAKMDLKSIEKTSREHLKNVKMVRASDATEIAIIEGPPTMNGIPHIGHIRGRVIKDLWYRYKTLQGYAVRFSAGWDAQGLPVELQAQKELGLTGSKSAITGEKIQDLVVECKRLVKLYNKKWLESDYLLGMSVDCSSAYWTYHDSFIEREWQVLRRAQKLGVLQDSYTVIAYCPKCQTSLSHTEVAQGYREVTDPSLYYKVKLAKSSEYLVVWTTMPFTLVTDALIGVHPDETYCRIKVGLQTWIVGKTRLKEFAKEAELDDYTIISEIPAAKLEGEKYIHPLLDNIPALGVHAKAENYHRVVAEQFVDTNTGSGLVHIAPANGEEDIKVARRRNVAIFNPINDEVQFTYDAGKYAGVFVRDADSLIINDVKSCNALVSAKTLRHKYPHCWRSGDALVWMARRGWFYILDGISEMTIKAAQDVEYFYEQPRNRFLGIVLENHPWCISRERFWGTPLPVWECESCDKKTWLYSRDDILKAAYELPDGKDFELHMPWIDRIKIKCSGCNGTKTKREQYVLDTWHNSGSSPYASLDDDACNRLIPAPFLSEGIDQTRGWAYTMLVENVILYGKASAPYSSFLFQGHVLDSNGNKMSKSQGNVIDACNMLECTSVDLVRFYFVWKSSPIEPLSFDQKELATRPYQVLSTLYNLHTYFEQNSTYDNYYAVTNIGSYIDTGLLSKADYWILSRLQNVIKDVTREMDKCHLHIVARHIEDFVINDLSQTYIPMTRSELWNDDDSKLSRRHSIYAVIAHVLKTVNVLLHPICPFITDYLYEKLFNQIESITNAHWPLPDDTMINDRLEESFSLVTKLVSATNAARSIAKLKRRWPLEKITLIVGIGQKVLLEAIHDILVEQLNIENLEILEIDAKLGPLERIAELGSRNMPVITSIALDRKACGPKARDLLPELSRTFEKTPVSQITNMIANTGKFQIRLKNTVLELDSSDVIITTSPIGDNAVVDREGVGVIVPTIRSAEMVCKGLVRDIARRLQALRKTRNHNPTDILKFASVQGLNAEQIRLLDTKLEELTFLVRVEKVVLTKVDGATYVDADIDGQQISIAVA